MYDDRCLVDLINKRFDDVNGRIAEIKADIVRKHDDHEKQDEERFSSISTRLGKFDRLSWAASGAAAVAFAVIQASWWAVQKYVLNQ